MRIQQDANEQQGDIMLQNKHSMQKEKNGGKNSGNHFLPGYGFTLNTHETETIRADEHDVRCFEV